MDCEYGSVNYRYLPHVIAADGKLSDVNYSFTDMTGYTKKDLYDKNIYDLFMVLFKMEVDLQHLEYRRQERSFFLFTKSSGLREVDIEVKSGIGRNEKVFVFVEKPNSRIEDRLPYLEQLFKSDIVGIGIYTVPDMKLLRANRKYMEMLGGSFNKKENSLGRRKDEITQDWTGSPLEEIWEKSLQTGETCHLISQEYLTSEMASSYWDVTISPVFDNGTPKFIVENVTEVTEKKHMDEHTKELIYRNMQIENVIENMSDALFIFDIHGKYITLNRSAKEYFPSTNLYKLEDWYSASNFFDEDGKEICFDDSPAAFVLRGQKVESRRMLMLISTREIMIDVSGTPIFDENGEFLMGVLCIRNITNCSKYEVTLKKQRDYMFKLIETLDLPILRLSYPDFDIIEVNKKAYAFMDGFYGCVINEIENICPGNNIIKVFPNFGKGENYRCINEAIKNKSTVYLNNFEIPKLEQKSYVNLIYQPLLGSEGEIEELLMIAVDVTREVEQKESLENILKMKDEFFSFISHEFKTPLTVIHSIVQTMEVLCKDELSSKSRGYLGKIRQNAFRQLRLVNNLLEITKAESGYTKLFRKNIDIVAFTKAIIDSVSLYAKERGVEMVFVSPFSHKVVGIDDEKIERIILNLLSNAIKFTPSGKSIYVKVYAKKNILCIEVKDEGVGIPKEKQKLIFERFGQVNSSQTRKSEGTGIGLCLVNLLVNAMHGNITLESEEGLGSMFTVMLPCEKIIINTEEEETPHLDDSRLVQSIAVEFSNIYMP